MFVSSSGTYARTSPPTETTLYGRDPILDHYRPRIPEARLFALEHRVLLIESPSGVPVGIALGGLPFEARVIDRSTPFDVAEGVAFETCSAEDLVVLKAFAGRVQDRLDIEGIIVRQGSRLDRALALEEQRPLLELKEDDEAESRLVGLFTTHQSGSAPA